MPELTISLTHEEYTDLERIAEERLQDPEQMAHDLLLVTCRKWLNAFTDFSNWVLHAGV